MPVRHHNGVNMEEPETNEQQTRPTPMIGNINSPSVSVASVSSDDCNEGQMQQPAQLPEDFDPKHLNAELRKLTEAVGRLRRTFQDTNERPECTQSVATERLGEMLGILRPLLNHYPMLQTKPVMGAASNLIDQVTQPPNSYGYYASAPDFYEAMDALRTALSQTVSEYVATDFERAAEPAAAGSRPRTSPNIVFPSCGGDPDSTAAEEISQGMADLDFNAAALARKDAILSVDQVDAVLMRHDRGVDMALERAKIWSKYAKDVITYVEKRIAIELDWAKNLAKLAQERRPVLKEESHLPFQSIYCFALDVVSN